MLIFWNGHAFSIKKTTTLNSNQLGPIMFQWNYKMAVLYSVFKCMLQCFLKTDMMMTFFKQSFVIRYTVVLNTLLRKT